MITTNTLLIVGAGASVPYGYPTGVQLRNELCNPANLQGLTDFVDKSLIEKFCEEFSSAQRYSIDSFLSHRADERIDSGCGNQSQCTFGQLGKLAIAHQLIKREISENLEKPVDPDDHWLMYLWSCMTRNDLSKQDFKSNNIKIISFNYDRVIEQYLQTVIMSFYGVDRDEANELRKQIEIVHVYGTLQNLDDRPYGKMDDLSKAAECIKVIPEARTGDDKEFTRAKEIISWARKICFIGFGFDDLNIHRLGLISSPLSELWGKDLDGAYCPHPGSEKYGFSRYKMTIAEISEVMKRLNGGYVLPSGMIRYKVNSKGVEKLKTLGYLKHINFFSE
ncbi:MAG: hypothetical protein KGZ80_10220 [Methylomonas sp.]|nr:hypothetical protein [Methylomonas sp.]PPD21711.1 MAG: hypothetical protein CTY23_04925 [Methylomonas sp.]